MNIPLHVVLAAAALAWAALLSAGTAYAATPTAEQRRLALVAHDGAVADRKMRREGRTRMQSPQAQNAHAKAVQLQFDRLCTFKPVMTDAEIDGCKLALKL